MIDNIKNDYVLYELFQKILGSVFSESEDDNIIEFQKIIIEPKNTPLLFIWPIIVCKRFLFPSNELELYKLQSNLLHNLENNNDQNKLQNILSEILKIGNHLNNENDSTISQINDSENNEKYENLLEFCKESYLKAKNGEVYRKHLSNKNQVSFGKVVDHFLGGKPSSKNAFSNLSNKILKKTVFNAISNKIIGNANIEKKIRKYIISYYIVLMLILKKHINNIDNCLNISDIINIIEKKLVGNDKYFDSLIHQTIEIIIAFNSYLFSDTIKFFIEDYKTIFLENGYNKDLDLIRHNFLKDDPSYFASFYKIDDKDDEDYGSYVIDVERELEISDNYSLEFWFQNNLSTNELLNLINLKHKKNQNVNLVDCILNIAANLSTFICQYTDQYNEFISNANISIDNNLDSFLENIDTIHNSYHLFSEYLEQKDFSKTIETLDMDLDYGCIDETRKILKKKRKNYLPQDLIKDLLTANKEIGILYNSVQRKHDAHRNKIAKKFFSENSQYFRIIQFDDIKNIDFTSNPNGIRDTRRKIFYNIVQRHGKDVSGSKIAKELALE